MHNSIGNYFLLFFKPILLQKEIKSTCHILFQVSRPTNHILWYLHVLEPPGGWLVGQNGQLSANHVLRLRHAPDGKQLPSAHTSMCDRNQHVQRENIHIPLVLDDCHHVFERKELPQMVLQVGDRVCVCVRCFWCLRIKRTTTQIYLLREICHSPMLVKSSERWS